MRKIIKLPVYNIVVVMEDDSGIITSDLLMPHENRLGHDPMPFIAAMNIIEAMVLAHAVAGVDIQSPAYLEGIETAVQEAVNRYGDE